MALDIGRYIAMARGFSEELMPDSCEIVRTGKIPDGMGDYTEGTSVVATTKCRLRPLTGRETAAASQVRAEVEGAVDLPLGTDVVAQDELRIAGKTYEVAAVLPRSEGLAAHVEVLVTRAS